MNGTNEHFRAKIDEIPRATIQVKLPESVQKAKTAIKKFAVAGTNGERIVVFELSLQPDQYDMSAEDRQVSFDV